MNLREPTPRGLANWQALSRAERYEAVLWAARRLTERGLVRALSPDAIRLGAGRRERRDETGKKAVGDSIALVVFVAKKWPARTPRTPRPRRTEARRVPEHVQLTVPLGGRRRVLALPTDVCEEHVADAQLARNGVRVRSLTDPGALEGSVSALVRNANAEDGPLYLLGCHHVLCRSLVTPGGEPDLTAISATIEDPPRDLGVATRPAPFGPGVPASIDAALARLSPGGREIVARPSFWKRVPRAIMDDRGQLPVFAPLQWRLFSRHRPSIPLRFHRHSFLQPVRYGTGLVVIIAQVLESVATPAAPRDPEAGDSGGAVMAGNVLLAMHIAGDGPRSIAIPTFLLFRTAAFKPRLELASELIGD